MLNLHGLVYKRADIKHLESMMDIILRCMKEVNAKDYQPSELHRLLESLIFNDF